MQLKLNRQVRVAVNREGVVRRRDFLRGVSLAGLAAGTVPWVEAVSAQAEQLRSRGMSCILLWMQGGPSQFETFDPKPGHENGGETKAISTAVPGISISENLPELAKAARDFSIIRSLTTKEGNHPRATFLMHTSYVPTASVHHPTLGSVVSRELGRLESELPAFVRIGNRFVSAGAGGLLGPDFNPFVVPNADRLPDNVQSATGADRFQRRLGLLEELETSNREVESEIEEHRGLYKKASRMVLSSQMQAFDLDREPAAVRDSYGKSDFGAGCLLARRLVESGVTFVEVGLGNWDTHLDNFDRSRGLCHDLDQPFARLLSDLKDRGMLEKTLVIWMGEFGRTPRINPRGGRDHYPRAFSGVVAGGGVRGGRIIGRTDAGGVDVADRPVEVGDLFRTFYKSLRIDADRENMSSIGRPIKIVDGGHCVDELFG